MSNIFTIKQDIEEFVNENKSLPAKDFLEKLILIINKDYNYTIDEATKYEIATEMLQQYLDLIKEVFPKSYFFRDSADLEDFISDHVDIDICL